MRAACRLCHIAAGTPGRLAALIQSEALKCESLTMFVLDEADALMGQSFYSDVTWIYDQLPRRKQVGECSASFFHEGSPSLSSEHQHQQVKRQAPQVLTVNTICNIHRGR